MSWQPPPEDNTELLSRAIEWRESSYRGAITPDSLAGAKGPMQIMPATWNQYAPRPGMDPHNPDDNRLVGRLIVKDLLKKYGTPARAASAYFSGSPDVPQRTDAYGTRVADYVESVMHKFNVLRGTSPGTIPIEGLVQYPDSAQYNPRLVPSPTDLIAEKLPVPQWQATQPSFLSKMTDAAKEGWGEGPIGNSPETQEFLDKFGPIVSQSGKSLGTLADILSRGTNALTMMGGEAAAQAALALGQTETQANQLRRDVPTMLNLGLMVGGTTPEAMGSPRMPKGKPGENISPNIWEGHTDVPLPKGLAVADDVRQRLINAGRPAVEAEANSEIWRAHMAYMGRLLGRTPEDVYKDIGLDIVKVEPKAAGTPNAIVKLGSPAESLNPAAQKAINDALPAIKLADQNHMTLWHNSDGTYDVTAGSKPRTDSVWSAQVVNTESGPVVYRVKGQAAFGQEGINKVYLGAGADYSTFLHESAHVFLLNLEKLKGQSAQLAEDFQAFSDWAKGQKPGGRPIKGSALGQNEHEAFARGFEKYLAEGKAPNERMQPIFDAFKGWMIQVYGNLDRLHVKLDPGVRKFMGRIIDDVQNGPSVAGAGVEGGAAETGKEGTSPAGPAGRTGEPLAGDVGPDGGLVRPVPRDINPPVNAAGNIRMPAGETVKPDYALNIGLRRITDGEDVRAVIADMADMYRGQFEEARRGVITNSAARDLAYNMGMTEVDLLKRTRGQAYNVEEMLSARDILVTSANRVADAMERATISGREQDLAEAARLALRHRMIQEQVHGAIAEAGRTLQILTTKAQDLAAADRRIIDALGGDKRVQQMAEHILRLDQKNRANYLAGATNPRLSDKLYWLYINGLLGGLKTHVANVTGNFMSTALDVGETFMAGNIPGKGGVVRGEAAAKAATFFTAQKEALEGLIKSGLQGADAQYALKVAEAVQPEPFNVFHGIAGSVFPTRWLTAEDAYFRILNYRMKLAALSVREAKSMGLRGQQLRDMIQQLRDSPTPEMIESASAHADYQTFVKDLGAAGRAYTNLIKKIPGGRWVSPFNRTPINLFKYAGERSPLAVLSPSVRAAIEGKNGMEAQQMAVARFLMGSAVATWVAAKVIDGDITGSGPADPAANRVWRHDHQPNSVRIGGQWISYARVEPVATIFGTIGDMIQGWQDAEASDKSMEDQATAFVSNIVSNMTDKTFISGPVTLMRAIINPQEYAKNYLYSLATSIEPRQMSMIAEMGDPYRRAATTIREQMERRVPGLRQDLPIMYDVLGDPLKYESIGPSWASPFDTQKADPNNLIQEMIRLRTYPSLPTKTIIFENSTIRLTTAEAQEVQQIRGQLIKMMGSQLTSNSQWPLMTFEQQQTMLQQVYINAGKAARMKVLGDILKGQDAVTRMKRKK